MSPVPLLAVLFLALQPTPAPADPAARALADRVMRAAGSDVWPSVRRLRFTFHVERDGKPALSATHDWDVRTGEAVVTVGGKTMRTNVLSQAERTGDDLAAFKRWTNDAYWLLMPLKLADPGVNLSMAGDKLVLSFAGVGLTPGDRYDLTVDPRTHRVTHWVYRPSSDKATGFTWDAYRDFNGLTLATDHRSDDGKLRIHFTDVAVVRD